LEHPPYKHTACIGTPLVPSKQRGDQKETKPTKFHKLKHEVELTDVERFVLYIEIDSRAGRERRKKNSNSNHNNNNNNNNNNKNTTKHDEEEEIEQKQRKI